MSSNVLKLLRALIVLVSLTFGFLSTFCFKWITDSDKGKSSFFLYGVTFSESDNKLKFADAVTKVCSFSEAYEINSTDAMANHPFAFFFEDRIPSVDPINFCDSIKNIGTPSEITLFLITVCQISILIVSGISNTSIIQGALDALTVIKRLNYIAIFCGICCLVHTASILIYSSFVVSTLSGTGINFRFSEGFYVAASIIAFIICISYTYWKEGVTLHNNFEQDRLQWQIDSSSQPRNNAIPTYNYIQIPTDFNSIMGGLQSPTEMAREIETKEQTTQ